MLANSLVLLQVRDRERENFTDWIYIFHFSSFADVRGTNLSWNPFTTSSTRTWMSFDVVCAESKELCCKDNNAPFLCWWVFDEMRWEINSCLFGSFLSSLEGLFLRISIYCVQKVENYHLWCKKQHIWFWEKKKELDNDIHVHFVVFCRIFTC